MPDNQDAPLPEYVPPPYDKNDLLPEGERNTSVTRHETLLENPGYDPRNLSLDQKRLIAALMEFQTQKEALAFCHISWPTHSRWIRTNVDYAEAVKRLGDGLLAEARAKMNSLVVQAANTFEEALEATKRIRVECPCGCLDEFEKPFSFYVEISDLKFRTSVAEKVLKPTILAPKVKVEGTVTHELSLEDRLAVARLQRGMSVSPDVRDRLARQGLLPALPAPESRTPDRGRTVSDSEPIEGSYRNLDSDSPAT